MSTESIMSSLPSSSGIELTKFVKTDGTKSAVLTKIAYVDKASGQIKIDGSECRMSCGRAHRLSVPSVHALAEAINSLGSNEAIAIGTLKEGVADGARVVIKRDLPKTETADRIARTKDFVQRRLHPVRRRHQRDAAACTRSRRWAWRSLACDR